MPRRLRRRTRAPPSAGARLARMAGGGRPEGGGGTPLCGEGGGGAIRHHCAPARQCNGGHCESLSAPRVAALLLGTPCWSASARLQRRRTGGRGCGGRACWLRDGRSARAWAGCERHFAGRSTSTASWRWRRRAAAGAERARGCWRSRRAGERRGARRPSPRRQRAACGATAFYTQCAAFKRPPRRQRRQRCAGGVVLRIRFLLRRPRPCNRSRRRLRGSSRHRRGSHRRPPRRSAELPSPLALGRCRPARWRRSSRPSARWRDEPRRRPSRVRFCARSGRRPTTPRRHWAFGTRRLARSSSASPRCCSSAGVASATCSSHGCRSGRRMTREGLDLYVYLDRATRHAHSCSRQPPSMDKGQCSIGLYRLQSHTAEPNREARAQSHSDE